jgi:hypothetical protein
VKPDEIAVARNGFANTPIGRNWLSGRHVMATAEKHSTIAELLEAVFLVRSIPRLYIDKVP